MSLLKAEREWTVDEADPFYADIAFTWDFYRTLRAWQTDLFANNDYGTAITSFASNFLFVTDHGKPSACWGRAPTADLT